MQLGSILSSTRSEPIVQWPITFYLMKKTDQGSERVEVRALLGPVSEADRIKAKAEAIKYLKEDPSSPYRTNDKENKPIELSEEAIQEEIYYKFLTFALLDEEQPLRKLVGPLDYPVFRAGLINKQVKWLYDEYNRFIDQEYPELLPAEKQDELIDAALGK